MGQIRKHYSPSFKAQVVLELLKETRSVAELAVEYGVHPSQLRRWRQEALEKLPQVFAQEASWQAEKARYDAKMDELYAEIGRLSAQLSWLKKKASTLTRPERLQLLDWTHRELPLRTQAELLGLNRSGLYYKPKPPSEEELALKRAIDEIYTDHPYYGSRRMTAELQRRGFRANRKAVRRHMREMGLEALYPGPNLSRRDRQHRVYPYLLRGLTISVPNQVWGTDITYIRLARGWLYLVVLLDWYCRYVVSWGLSDSLEVDFVLAAVEAGFARARPEILNSDQGSQYTSPAYIQLVEAAGVRISMDGRGRAIDNVFTERLWRALKYEEVYLKDYSSPREARLSIGQYFEFYNHHRPHQALDYRTPAEVYVPTSP